MRRERGARKAPRQGCAENKKGGRAGSATARAGPEWGSPALSRFHEDRKSGFRSHLEAEWGASLNTQ